MTSTWALDLAADNATAAIAALLGLGLRPRLPVPASAFADEATRESWVAERNLIAFTMLDPDHPLREVDLLAVSPVPYAELSSRAELTELDGVPVRIASVADLIRMKKHSDRAQDRADIEALEMLSGEANAADNDPYDS